MFQTPDEQRVFRKMYLVSGCINTMHTIFSKLISVSNDDFILNSAQNTYPAYDAMALFST